MTTASTIRQRWLAGHGPIVHGDETVERMEILLTRLIAEGRVADETTAYTLLAAADRLSCVAMNVVAHMTYARRIDLSGAALSDADFKPTPEGHIGGSLNMVQAFVGYLLANASSATCWPMRSPAARAAGSWARAIASLPSKPSMR